MQMIRANCIFGCGPFDVVSLPMPAETACKAMLARNVCPWCGTTKGHTMADPRPLTDEERTVKARALERAEAQRTASQNVPPRVRSQDDPAGDYWAGQLAAFVGAAASADRSDDLP